MSKNQQGKETAAANGQSGKSWKRFIGAVMGINHFLLTLAALCSAGAAWLWYSCGDAAGIWNPIQQLRRLSLSLQLPAAYRGLSGLKGLQLIVSQENGAGAAVDMWAPMLIALTAFVLFLLLSTPVRVASTAAANGRVQRQMKALSRLEQEAKELARADLAELDRQRSEEVRRLAELSEDITNLSPTDPGTVEADDPNLQGISHAVNDLVERMHDSYRQQVRFVSDASHELRTPIAVIKGYADMLDRWGTEDETVLREAIAAIKTETDSMNRLVEQLLFLARGDSGRTKLQLAAVSLTDLVRELYSECTMIDTAHSYRLDADSEISVQADRALLKQAARVLCDNAAKYTPEGGEIILHAGLDGEGAPFLSVEDRGIGISKKDAPSIFERFFRADKGREQNTKGSGLGLSIAKWIVQQHDGKLDVTSVEEVGTRFRITLPKQ